MKLVVFAVLLIKTIFANDSSPPTNELSSEHSTYWNVPHALLTSKRRNTWPPRTSSKVDQNANRMIQKPTRKHTKEIAAQRIPLVRAKAR